jgi:putative Holliday junction resolvase
VRVLAIDLGAKRIGAAVSDHLGISMRPLDTFQSAGADGDIKRLRGMVEDLEVEAVVLGLPLRLDGSVGDAARRVISFAELLRAELAVPVFTQDERLTSFEADHLMAEHGVPRGDRRKHSDAVAATLILRDFLSTCGDN